MTHTQSHSQNFYTVLSINPPLTSLSTSHILHHCVVGICCAICFAVVYSHRTMRSEECDICTAV